MIKLRSYLILSLFFFAITTNAQNAKQHFKAGERFFENGLIDAAIEEFNWSLRLDPNDGRTYEALAQVLLVKGDSLRSADNYKRAAALDYDAAINYHNAARLFLSLGKDAEGLSSINAGLESKPRDIDLLIQKTKYYFEQKNWAKANEVSAEAIKSKDLALAYYYNGASAYKLGLYEEAEKNLEKSIIRDKNLVPAYLTIAEMQIEQERFDYAIDNCNMVLLLMDTENVWALTLRSKAHHHIRESDEAIADITKAIGLSDNDYSLILSRAQINLDYALYADAIHDYSIALEMNDSSVEALKSRAYAYEQLGYTTEALEDYKKLQYVLVDKSGYETLLVYAQSKIFELGKETTKPQLTLSEPNLNLQQELTVEEGKEEVVLKGIISEESGLKELKINNVPIDFAISGKESYMFEYTISALNLDFISITAIDIYDNIATESYPISYVETEKPTIDLISPIAGGADIIQLETDDNTLYIEGRVFDKSNIVSIRIDEVNASFTPGDYNPKFTATIEVQNRKNITVVATDAFGNESSKTYEFAKDGYLLSDNNPMGKTWVVVVENTKYDEYTNLGGPAKDVAMLTEALKRYQVSKVLHKKNMTKRELERFFTIDLRDLILSNQVNSLLIWYAGHGENINDMGFWIPVDARQGDEYSFYNINALKASLYSYRSLTHILVISDACHAGESFTIAMRGANNSMATCNDLDLLTQKSALVLTSAYREPALDNSLFTKTFANALANNPADCIPVDAIADRITIVMNKHTGQKPQFGKIAGLEDKNGTFFFIAK